MGRKVLVADDEAHIRHVLSMKLANAGYEVVTATDGEEALEVHSADGATIHRVEILRGAPVANLPAAHGARFERVYPAGTDACAPGVEPDDIAEKRITRP